MSYKVIKFFLSALRLQNQTLIMKPIDKLKIADEMMTAAIVECVEHRRYFAAINLAGVAEELYGKLLHIYGEKTMRDEVIDSVLFEDKGGLLNRKKLNFQENQDARFWMNQHILQ